MLLGWRCGSLIVHVNSSTQIIMGRSSQDQDAVIIHMLLSSRETHQGYPPTKKGPELYLWPNSS